jgi:hypothetical protein
MVLFLAAESVRSDTLGQGGRSVPNSLPSLLQQRDAILHEILSLGDFRSGSITTTGGKCGKPNCHCHQAGSPGHGPHYRLTRKQGGKTVTESFSSPAELRKARSEVEAFHRFQSLSGDLLEVNEKICRARPVEDSLTPQEKKGASGPLRSPARSRSHPAGSVSEPTQERPVRPGIG